MTVEEVPEVTATGDPNDHAYTGWPQTDQTEVEALRRVLRRGRFVDGAETEALEREWAVFCGVKHAVALSSGTAAVQAGLYAAGVRKGDEVIVPAFTFSGTVLPVLHLGAVPVFADVDPVSFNLSAATVAPRITPRTAAIVPVHMHGLPAPIDELDRFGVPLIEDACQAHGAKYHTQRVGGLGLAGAFSLNHTKHLPAGEGGLLTTNHDDVALSARRFRRFGEHPASPDGGPGRSYEVVDPLGGNYRMDEFCAAVARCQLRRLLTTIDTARRNAAVVARHAGHLDGLVLPSEPAETLHVWHKYRIRTPSADYRMRLHTELERRRVPVGRWQIMPCSDYHAFQPYRPADGCPNARALLASSLVLFSEQLPLCAQTQPATADTAQHLADAWADVLDRQERP